MKVQITSAAEDPWKLSAAGRRPGMSADDLRPNAREGKRGATSALEAPAQPLISVVIPCFNREKLVTEAISSALEQPYNNLEVLVVDDGSTDGSWEAISAFGTRIRAIKTENRGVSAARNRGIEAARGDFILFLDSDDRLEPGAILAYGHLSDADPLEIRIGHRRLIDEEGNPIQDDPKIAGFDRGRVLSAVDILSVWAPNWACLIPKSLLVAAGGYDEGISLGEDYDLNLRMLRCGARFRHIGDLTYQLRVHGGQKLTRSVPRQRYERMFHVFQAAWNVYETDFRNLENYLQRVRFAQWVWSVGRVCFRAKFPDLGYRYVELATRISGLEARNGSVPVLFAYLFFPPYLVERSVEFFKKFCLSQQPPLR